MHTRVELHVAFEASRRARRVAGQQQHPRRSNVQCMFNPGANAYGEECVLWISRSVQGCAVGKLQYLGRHSCPVDAGVLTAAAASVGDTTADLLLMGTCRGINVLTACGGQEASMSNVEMDVSGTSSDVDRAAPLASFGTVEELATAVAAWPMAQLVALWNSVPGLVPVNRFTDRATAIRRIGKALHLPAGDGTVPIPANPRRPRPEPAKALARPASKKARVIELLQRPSGATLKEIMEATGWQAHSVRGFISGNLLKKAALQVTSTRRSDGERVYQLSRGAASRR